MPTNESSDAIIAPRLGEDPELSADWTWPRFRLRTLFLLVFLICMPLASWGLRLMRTRVQEDIVSQLAISGAEAGWYGGDVTQLTFRGASFDKASLARLAELPKLRRIVMIDTNVNADTLNAMANLDLQELRVRRATQLKLPNPDPQPQRSSTSNNDVSRGEDVSSEGGSTELKERASKQTAPAAIRWSPDLQTLGLEETELDNRIVDTLGPLRQLQTLSLSGSPVDDNCVEALARLTTLQKLFLQQTKFTETGVDRLRRELPKAVIIWEP